jgi:hypothetical protein
LRRANYEFFREFISGNAAATTSTTARERSVEVGMSETSEMLYNTAHKQSDFPWLCGACDISGLADFRRCDHME